MDGKHVNVVKGYKVIGGDFIISGWLIKDLQHL